MLFAHDIDPGLCNQELAFHQYIIQQVPVFFCMIFQWFGDRYARAVYNDIDPAECNSDSIHNMADACAVSHIKHFRSISIFSILFAKLITGSAQAFCIIVIDHHACPLCNHFFCNGFANPPRASRYQGDSSIQRFWFRHALQLRFFQ